MTQASITTGEKLPPGYRINQSEYGGFYFEIGEFGSQDHATEAKAATAARHHHRLTRKANPVLPRKGSRWKRKDGQQIVTVTAFQGDDAAAPTHVELRVGAADDMSMSLALFREDYEPLGF